MAKRPSRKAKTPFAALKQNMGKVLLGVIAIGSFAIAFGGGKVKNLLPTQTSNSQCLTQFYQNIPPILSKASLQKNSYALCFNGFNVMYSGVSKTPLWSAEHLTPQRLSVKIKREDSFHEETRIPEQYRAVLADYRGSGYDRGHMSPNADMSNKVSQADSFSLANMVPQAPKNNQQIWRELEEATRAMVTKQKQDVYVITGPTFEGSRLKTIGHGVIVPTAVYKAVYYPKQGVTSVYYAPNNNTKQVKIISICELEDKVGINIFPQLTEQQKRNVYQLPKTAQQVRAKSKLSYSHWDGESQCAEAPSRDMIQSQQQQFASKQLSAASNSSLNVDDDTKKAIVSQLLQVVVQYFLQRST